MGKMGEGMRQVEVCRIVHLENAEVPRVEFLWCAPCNRVEVDRNVAVSALEVECENASCSLIVVKGSWIAGVRTVFSAVWRCRKAGNV